MGTAIRGSKRPGEILAAALAPHTGLEVGISERLSVPRPARFTDQRRKGEFRQQVDQSKPGMQAVEKTNHAWVLVGMARVHSLPAT